MRRLHFSFWLITLIFTTQNIAYSQAFKNFNGRNHAQITWVETESEHFKIVFPKHLEGIQHEAHTVAEQTFSALSKTLGVTFEDKIRIYLFDGDEIANGFAVPFRPYYTDIWVNTNEWADYWTGNVKWMRKVLAHELAHIFHFEMTRTNVGLWNVVFNDPMPSQWAEGFAQYQTEKWDAYRGEMWMRKAIFDDNINWSNPNARDNGRLIYAAGNAQLRFFNQTYGDSMFNKLTNYRDTVYKFITLHDFEEAFEETMEMEYDQFVNQWKKHLNIYYNTIAGQVNRTDSLGGKEIDLPGTFYGAADYSVTGDSLVVVSLESMARPVWSLNLLKKVEKKSKKKDSKDSTKTEVKVEKVKLLERPILPHVRISNTGEWIVFASSIRGKYGAIVPEVFLYNTKTKKTRQVTENMRASYPVFNGKGDGLYFIAFENGIANVWQSNLDGSETKNITKFTLQNEMMGLDISPDGKQLVFSQFTHDAKRNLTLFNVATGELQVLDNPEQDNKNARFSLDGTHVYYEGYRDDVPNVFVMNLDEKTEERVTWQFTGASLMAIKPDSAGSKVLINASESRNSDKAFYIDSDRRAPDYNPTIAPRFSAWKDHQPPNMIPYKTEIDESLASAPKKHVAIKETTHLLSFGLPVIEPGNIGVFGTTSWTDPLGKHIFNLSFAIEQQDFENSSLWLASYQNNTFYPAITFSAFKIPSRGQFVQDQFVLNNLTGGEISTSWPLNFSKLAYTTGAITTRNRYARFSPIDVGGESNVNAVSDDAIQADMELSFILRKQKPYAYSSVHALDGSGLRVSVLGAVPMLASSTEFIRSDITAFYILPLFWKANMFFHARNQIQWGSSLAQDFVGFSRYDNIRIAGLPVENLFFANAERVRGYREFAIGEQAAFASTEFRVPFLKDLRTKILGFLEIGGISGALFADYGVVGDRGLADNGNRREFYSTGWEIKNAIGFGPFKITHAFGAGYAESTPFDGSPVYHYRIQGTIPF